MTTEPTPDPYETLGVSRDANEARIRKAWQKKIKALGPGSSDFAAVNDAAELLLDADRRADYDADVKASQEVVEKETVEAAATDEPAVSQSGLVTRTRRGLTGWGGTVVIAGVLALVAIVLAVWQAVVYTQPKQGPGTGGVPAANFDQSPSVQQAVLSAVRIGLSAVLSYRYDQMPADQANAQRFLTAAAQPRLASSYQQLINGGTAPGCTTAMPPIATRQLVVATTFVTAGIVSVRSSDAEVGAFVNTTSTAAGQAAVTHQNRVDVKLKKVGGQWLIDSMTVPNTDHVLSC